MRLRALCVLLALTTSGRGNDNVLSPTEKADGFVLLFNGEDFERFRPSLNYGQWIVEEGAFRTCLFGQSPKFVTPPHLFTAETYANYILKVDFKLPPEPRDTHSGIILRVGGTPPNVEAKGLEIDIYGAGRKLGLACTGSFRHELRAPTKNALKGGGVWNTFVITVQGNRVAVVLNDTPINELNLEEWTTTGKRPDGSALRVPIALHELPKRDAIGFRTDHGNPIWFKNIKIKPLEK